MADPVIAQKTPYSYDVKEGEKYFWCSCGKSTNQPFCDGSHKGSEFDPLGVTAEETKTVFFCGCKHSANKPYCDGNHKDL
jgi:CDGSH-type Zn-finger protein